MSSDYRVLCLSHDPAIPYDRDYHTAAEAEQAIRDGVPGHGTCDLMIGRYSYPLVELGCPGRRLDSPRTGEHNCPVYHTTAVWADVEWVRLLAHAQQQPVGTPLHTLSGAQRLRCFPPERLRRLRDELQRTVEDQPWPTA